MGPSNGPAALHGDEALRGRWEGELSALIRALRAPCDKFGDWIMARGHPLRWFGAGVLMALVGLTTIRALDGLLREMHAAGDVAAGLGSGLLGWPDNIAAVVQGWRNFADADLLGRYLSAPALVWTSLAVDTLLFVPGYLLAGSVLLLQGARWNGDWRAAIRPGWRVATQITDEPVSDPVKRQARRDAKIYSARLRRAFCALVALAVVDCIENVMSAIVVGQFWPARGMLVDPSGWATALAVVLVLVTAAKWVLAIWVIGELLLLGGRYLAPRLRPAGATLRVLRAQLTVAVILLLVLRLPMQVPDAILRLSPGSYLWVVFLAALLAIVQWSISRHLTQRATDVHSRDRQPGNRPAPQAAWVLGFGLCVLAMLVIGAQVWWADAKAGDLAREVLSGPGAALALLGLLALATWLTRSWWKEPEAAADTPDQLLAVGPLPRLLGVAVPVLVGLAVTHHAVGSVAFRRHWAELWRLGGGLLLVLIGVGLYFGFEVLEEKLEQRPQPGGWGKGRYLSIVRFFTFVGVVAGITLTLWVYTLPVLVGAIGIVLLFLVVASGVTGMLVAAAEWASTRYYLPSALRVVRLRRAPVFGALLVWVVAAAQFDSGAHWEVRRLASADRAAAPTRISLEDAWSDWLRTQQAAAKTTTTATPDSSGGPAAQDATRPAVPLVIVSASGGGIRAATWTALAMRCLFEGQPATYNGTPTGCAGPTASGRPPPTSSVLLASGISGSSVGLAEFVAHLTTEAARARPDEDWVTSHLKADFVSSQLAWQLLVETPRALLHFRAPDRAEVLERSWERSWDAAGSGDEDDNPMARGLLATQLAADRRGQAPLLLLNGDSVHDGCWLVASALDEGLWAESNPKTLAVERPSDCHNLDPYTSNRRMHTRGQSTVFLEPKGWLPGTLDVADFLCAREDLRLSTAALLSARFPGVSPAGRLSACGDPRQASPPRTKFVLDGGVIESSASEVALAAWNRLRPLVDEHNAGGSGPCVVPFFLQLDNGYLSSTAEVERRPPNQLQAPLLAAAGAGGGSRAERARQAAALAFSGAQVGTMQAHGPNGRPLEARYERLVPLGHPGPQASLGWALSSQTQADLEEQLYVENDDGIARIRQWLTSPLTCGTPSP